MSNVQSLTNWGRDQVVTDLTPDDNAIVVVAFLQICQPTSAGTISVPYQLGYGGSVAEAYQLDIEVTGAPPITPVSRTINYTLRCGRSLAWEWDLKEHFATLTAEVQAKA